MGRWQMSFWLWPLPPPGSLTWFGMWPAVGADEVSVAVDASVLESAAQEAEVLWVADAAHCRSDYSRSTMSRMSDAAPGDAEPPSPTG